jgi:hypothetical protein
MELLSRLDTVPSDVAEVYTQETLGLLVLRLLLLLPAIPFFNSPTRMVMQ